MTVCVRMFVGVFLLASGMAHAIQLRVATVAPEGTSWLKEMRAAGDEIKAGTDGRVELRFYPGGVMGNDTTVLRKIKIGQLQGGAFTSGELAAVNPNAVIYGLPFMFTSRAEAAAVRTALDPLMQKGFEEAGFVVPGVTGGGFAYLFSTKPIDSVAALQATKVWAPAGDFIAKTAFESGGIQPISLSIGDVYTALQTGMIETAGNTPQGALAFQWHTKMRTMLDLPLSYITAYLAFDKRAVDKLSAADQIVLREAVGKAFVRLEEISFAEIPKARAALEQEGITLVAPNAEQAQALRDIGAKATAQLVAEGKVSKEMLTLAQDALSKVRSPQ